MKTNINYYFFKKLKEKHVPLHVQIELTTKCNNNCIHCIREKDIEGELTTSKIKELISQLKEAGCMQLTFTGGEPLLRKDFFEICDFAKSEGFVLRLFSNATLVNRSVAKKLKKLKFKEVRITLFSIKKEVHDSITQNPGSLQKVLKAIGLLKKNNIPFRISAVVMKRNICELNSLREKAEKENWQFSCDSTIYPTYLGLKYPILNRITDRDFKFFKASDYFRGYKNINLKWNELNYFYLGNLHCYISADGRVFPHATIRLELGKLAKQPFKEIWQNSANLNWLRRLNINDFECSYCEYFLNCLWNLGLALSEHGKITAKPKEYCRMCKHKKEVENESQ